RCFAQGSRVAQDDDSLMADEGRLSRMPGTGRAKAFRIGNDRAFCSVAQGRKAHAMQEQQIHTNTNDQHLAPSTGSRDPAEREQWWLWPVISLLGYIAVLVVNYLANSLPLNNQRTGDITDAYIVPFQPAGWV